MNKDQMRDLLDQVRGGRLSIDAALERLHDPQIADLSYAHVDLHRRQRCGFPEVVCCEGKTCEWVEGVVRQHVEAGQDCLATRMNSEQFEHMSKLFSHAELDRTARTFWLPAQSDKRETVGRVMVLTAGTSDMP